MLKIEKGFMKKKNSNGIGLKVFNESHLVLITNSYLLSIQYINSIINLYLVSTVL